MGALRKALSVWQPYASLLMSGEKEFETRSWSTAYRGPLAICSTMTNPYQVVSGLAAYTAKVIGEKLHGTELDKLPLGYVLGIVELINCIPITREFVEKLKVSEEALGNFKAGHFAWCFGKRKLLRRPVPVKGRQGLWTLERDTWREVEKVL